MGTGTLGKGLVSGKATSHPHGSRSHIQSPSRVNRISYLLTICPFLFVSTAGVLIQVFIITCVDYFKSFPTSEWVALNPPQPRLLSPSPPLSLPGTP